MKPGGYFLIFDEAYPETDLELQTMPTRFAALAQWYEVSWGNVVDTRSALHARRQEAGLRVTEETSFSRFSIIVGHQGVTRVGPRIAAAIATKRPDPGRGGRR